MKKVRFESPNKSQQTFKMNDSECHSPRPFIESELRTNPPELSLDYPRLLPFTNDPIQRYDHGNSSPYPVVSPLCVPSFSEKEAYWKPCDDLNLSLLDASNHEPRQPVFSKSILKENIEHKNCGTHEKNDSKSRQKLLLQSSGSNEISGPPNILVKDNSFFLKRDNVDTSNGNPMLRQLNRLNPGKENDPLAKKANFVKTGTFDLPPYKAVFKSPTTVSPTVINDCSCHHCSKSADCMQSHPYPSIKERLAHESRESVERNCICSTIRNKICSHCDCLRPLSHIPQNICQKCNYHCSETLPHIPQSAVDKKTWAIEKYEESKQPNSKDIEKQTNVSKEKREPTVADLFKIIKLQNEQLQLLQEKVDKFMSLRQIPHPTITCSTEHVAVNTVQNDQHKMSIGVMTSFEMIRTSTVFNKEVLKQSNENSQIQCNRSHISVKEVPSKTENMNFLDGIIPKNVAEKQVEKEHSIVNVQQTEKACEEKTLNELSLYNVQIDNATTPLMSPDQTLYLDVRDYSDSEASSNDQSNVGWTYYNKVMTHVNGMLQDSDMPSSASAMYRNMRQQCVQMHIDKTNVSVTKRVKFGDDPLGVHQPHIYAAPATETSLKMNQLAAKYLKNAPAQAQRPMPVPSTIPMDMSIATRNYMEKHRLLQGLPGPSKLPQAGEIPRFLDITALKQQPKFL